MLKATTKKLGLMLIVVLLFSAICDIMKASFSGSVELEPSLIEANKNDEITIEVKLICDYVDGAKTLVGMQINYDKSILEYEGAEAVADQMLDTRFESDGLIFCNSPIKNGKTSNLFKVKFKVKDVEELPDTTEIGFENINATDKEPEGSLSLLSSRYVTVSFVHTTTDEPTVEPTIDPTTEPTVDPTAKPTIKPTIAPTAKPTAKPTSKPSIKPTIAPTTKPTAKPTSKPSIKPTIVPTIKPTAKPTVKPTTEPSIKPTIVPTAKPTAKPTIEPTTETTQTPYPKEISTPNSNIELPQEEINKETNNEINKDVNITGVQLVNMKSNDKKDEKVYKAVNTGKNKSNKSQLIALVLLIILVIVILFIKKRLQRP